MRRPGFVEGAVLLLLAACGTPAPYEGRVDPALFRPAAEAAPPRADPVRATSGRATPAPASVARATPAPPAPAPAEPLPPPLPGKVALVMPPGVADQVDAPMSAVRVHIGQIVGQASETALRDSLQGGATRLAAPPAAGAGYGATLTVQAIRFSHRQQLLWLVPLPGFVGAVGQVESTVRLAIELSLIDAQGRTVWTRTYADDAGRVVLPRFEGIPESQPQAIVRLAHEAAWRLARQLAGDYRAWWAEERARPREL